jgi:hypothetical protein
VKLPRCISFESQEIRKLPHKGSHCAQDAESLREPRKHRNSLVNKGETTQIARLSPRVPCQDGLCFTPAEGPTWQALASSCVWGEQEQFRILFKIEIKSRVNSADACCHAVQNLLSFRLLPKDLKLKK